jgi:hypothetical protein
MYRKEGMKKLVPNTQIQGLFFFSFRLLFSVDVHVLQIQIYCYGRQKQH